jgi:Lrp/AsnC family transcriptional regulator for asnA, asnC and gidA
MDELDNYILRTLTNNARISFRSIANKTDRSTDTIINRYNNMQYDGIIRGSTIVVDINEIGYEGMASFYIDATTTKESSPDFILETLIKMPNIIVATKTVGEHDLLAIAVIHNVKHYMEIGEEIAKIPGVKDLSSSLWAGDKEMNPKYFIV